MTDHGSKIAERPVVNSDNLGVLTDAMNLGLVKGDFHPAVYVIEPTNRCNVNCIMCPNSRFANDQLGDIDEAVFCRIAEQIAPFAELAMLYFLGESTLHPNFPLLLSIARKTPHGRIVVSTNGLDLSDQVIASLVGNVDLVIICIDRWNAAAYEKIRKGSNFARAVACVERLVAARLGASTPTIVVKTLDIGLPGDSTQLLNDENRAFVEFWNERGALPLSGWLNTWAGQLPGLRRLARQSTPYLNLPRSPCSDLWFKMVINWRGEVPICCHDWSSSIVLGDLTKNTVLEVWHSDAIASLRAAHIRGNYGSNSLCSNCTEWGTREEMLSYVNLTEDDLYRVF